MDGCKSGPIFSGPVSAGFSRNHQGLATDFAEDMEPPHISVIEYLTLTDIRIWTDPQVQ